MASSSSTNHLSREFIQLLCTWGYQSSVIRVDVSVLTRWQQPAAVSTTQTAEPSVLSTVLSVKTLVGEARIPFPVQGQVHSE